MMVINIIVSNILGLRMEVQTHWRILFIKPTVQGQEKKLIGMKILLQIPFTLVWELLSPNHIHLRLTHPKHLHIGHRQMHNCKTQKYIFSQSYTHIQGSSFNHCTKLYMCCFDQVFAGMSNRFFFKTCISLYHAKGKKLTKQQPRY